MILKVYTFLDCDMVSEHIAAHDGYKRGTAYLRLRLDFLDYC